MRNHSCVIGWVFWLACASASSVSHAADEVGRWDARWLAMADIGAIKNDLSPADPAANVAWSQLTEQQRAVLAPLGGEWDSLRPWQREKMLDIAKEYPRMDASKQKRIQDQLVKWSRMTPYERENARKRYQQFQSLSPEKKDVLRKQWKEHKQKAAITEGYDPEFDGVEH